MWWTFLVSFTLSCQFKDFIFRSPIHSYFIICLSHFLVYSRFLPIRSVEASTNNGDGIFIKSKFIYFYFIINWDWIYLNLIFMKLYRATGIICAGTLCMFGFRPLPSLFRCLFARLDHFPLLPCSANTIMHYYASYSSFLLTWDPAFAAFCTAALLCEPQCR